MQAGRTNQTIPAFDFHKQSLLIFRT